MFKQRSRRSGFTLPEVLVTVAIVAVLAAMVVPAVTQQISKGDAPSTLGSVTSLRTALASFVADVRALPGTVDQLSVDIDNTKRRINTNCTAPNGALYSTAIADRWRGPYENSGVTTGQIPIGMGWVTSNCIVDSLGYVVVTLTLTGGARADHVQLDAAIDNGNGYNAGMLRWNETVAGTADVPGTVKLLLSSSAQ